MASSKVTSLQHSSRRPRDSSDDFGVAGSLGSIGGSEVGSSVGTPSAPAVRVSESTAETAATKAPRKTPQKTKPIETIEVKKKRPVPALQSESSKEDAIAAAADTPKPKKVKIESPESSAKKAAAKTQRQLRRPRTDSTKGQIEGNPSIEPNEEDEKKPLADGTKGTKIRKAESSNVKLKKSPPPPEKHVAIKTESSIENDSDDKKASTKAAKNPTTTVTTASVKTERETEPPPPRIRIKKRPRSESTMSVTSTTPDGKLLPPVDDDDPSAMPPIEVGSTSMMLRLSTSADTSLRIIPGPGGSVVDPLPSIHAALSSKNSSKILPSVSARLSANGRRDAKILPGINGALPVPPSVAAAPGDSSDADTTSQGSGPADAHKVLLPHLDALPSMDSLPNIDLDGDKSPLRVRSESIMSMGTFGLRALDHLDDLGNEAKAAVAKFKLRKRSLSVGENSKGSGGSQDTLSSHHNRYLVEALLDDGSQHSGIGGKSARRSRLDSIGSAGGRARLDSIGSATGRDRFNSFDADFEEERLSTFHDDLKRERLNSTDFDFSLRRDRLNSLDFDFSSRRERLNSLDMDFAPSRRERGVSEVSGARRGGGEERKISFEERKSSFDSQGERKRRARERTESWGGMSELSIPMDESNVGDSLVGGEHNTSAVHLAASIYTSLANDLTKAANPDDNASISSFLVSDEKIPTKISVQRDRLDSNTSNPSNSSEIGRFVKNAIESMGDTLADIANAANEATKDSDLGSQASSGVSALIGAVASDHSSKIASAQPASVALSVNLDIAVDYDAVAAAVDAAQAAAVSMDLSTLKTTDQKASALSAKKKKKRQRPLPLHASKGDTGKASSSSDLPPIPESKVDEKELQVIRERARAAAGYVPPPKGSVTTPFPPKKKAKLDAETPGQYSSVSISATPKSATFSIATPASKASIYSHGTPASSIKSTPAKGQSSQKWDNMFDCLILFIEERKKEETIDMSEEDKKAWIWDGNVPTTFKTKDGKALGRWVNNQRSAKSKGVLKEERETRLVDAGLKWSVLASNSWNEMLEELRIYVAEQTKAGRKWDGNVPTNYRIKTKLPTASKDDEDKNLGRWVNRQRSLFSAGKLRKDRQKALEEVGLKWSMLATTSWESMYETLSDYVAQKTKGGDDWDGNVPANYKTNDNPPRALGRWINRQRSAYGKDKLKPECVAKLNKIGLKWSVHERRPTTVTTPATVRSVGSIRSPTLPTATPSSTARTALVKTSAGVVTAKPDVAMSRAPVAKPTGVASAPGVRAVAQPGVPLTSVPVAKPGVADSSHGARTVAQPGVAATRAPAPEPTSAVSAPGVKAVTQPGIAAARPPVSRPKVAALASTEKLNGSVVSTLQEPAWAGPTPKSGATMPRAPLAKPGLTGPAKVAGTSTPTVVSSSTTAKPIGTATSTATTRPIVGTTSIPKPAIVAKPGVTPAKPGASPTPRLVMKPVGAASTPPSTIKPSVAKLGTAPRATATKAPATAHIKTSSGIARAQAGNIKSHAAVTKVPATASGKKPVGAAKPLSSVMKPTGAVTCQAAVAAKAPPSVATVPASKPAGVAKPQAAAAKASGGVTVVKTTNIAATPASKSSGAATAQASGATKAPASTAAPTKTTAIRQEVKMAGKEKPVVAVVVHATSATKAPATAAATAKTPEIKQDVKVVGTPETPKVRKDMKIKSEAIEVKKEEAT